LFGAWLLDEPIEAGFLVGAIPVLVGIVLVSAGPWLGQIWADTFKARTR
jgi:drug/metabolite transporter (DMT)-like permease